MTTEKPILTKTNIFLGIIILILLYLVTCNRKVTPIETPQVIPVKEQVKAVASVDSLKKVIGDSFVLVQTKLENKANEYYKKWQSTDVKLSMAERAVDDLLNEPANPDTCKEILQKVQDGFNTVKKTYIQKDEQAKGAIKTLQQLTQSQKSFLTQKDKEYKLLHTSFDTCIAQQVKLEKINKALTPKHEIGIGANVITNYLNLKPQVGANLYYRTKNGTQVTLGYYTNNLISLSLSKPLIRFK